MISRRNVLCSICALSAMTAADAKAATEDPTPVGKLTLSEAQWRQRLGPAQFAVLRRAETEPAFSSPLNDEKRLGTYFCAGCDLALFDAASKFDSGTGWPSFTAPIPGHVETRRGLSMLVTHAPEYHSARCGGHQGHIFDDGPPPTGKRYCDNGIALKFLPA